MIEPTFLTITVTEDNMNHEATEYTGTGTLVADQSGWIATTNGTVETWYDPLNQSLMGIIRPVVILRKVPENFNWM